MSDMERTSGVVRWWAAIVIGALVALLIAWLGHLTGVSLRVVLSIAAGAAALAWLIVLVAVPWNLYFGARRVVIQMAVSRARGINIAQAEESEAVAIARRMLWFALGGHLLTAAAAGVVSYVSGATIGYYAMAAYLLSATIRPAAAYFAHLRERIARCRGRACTRARTRSNCASGWPCWPRPRRASSASLPSHAVRWAMTCAAPRARWRTGPRTRANC
jgi:hypothetical protein